MENKKSSKERWLNDDTEMEGLEPEEYNKNWNYRKSRFGAETIG